MCLVVYLASPTPLPTIPWDEGRPGFHVEDVAPAHAVCRRFDYPHVYYLGSQTGCGCGFSEPPDGLAACRALSDFLQAAPRSSGPLELFASWSGEEHWPHREPRDVLSPAQALDPAFWEAVSVEAAQNRVFAWLFVP